MKTTIETYINQLIEYGKNQFDELLNEGKIVWTDSSVVEYDVYNWDDKSYEKWGYFSKYAYQKGYRKNVKNIIKGTTISGTILNRLKSEEFYKTFLNLVSTQSQLKETKIIEDFHKYFFYKMVHGEHEYEKPFAEKHVEHLFILLVKGKMMFSNKHMVAGISCTKLPLSINLEDIEIIIKRPEVKEFVKNTQELNLPLQQFSCWIEFRTIEGMSEYWRDKNLLMRPFRLYKLGSVYTLGSTNESYTGKQGGRTIIQHHKRNYYNYKLSPDDSKPLEQLFSQIFAYLFELNNLKLKKKKKVGDIIKYSLQVAIERYEEIILEVNNDEDKRVAFAIMGMEALYNLDTDKETIGFKLKIRVAKILGFFGMDSIEVAKSISKAYGIRSAYAHGSATSKDMSFDFEERIIEFLRISILIFLQIEITKSAFIQLLNESFYNDEKNKEFKLILNKISSSIVLNINKEICP